MTSYYDVLGVGADAAPDEVRRAYHRKAQLLHPDRYAGSSEVDRKTAEDEMKVVNEAWTALRNPEARRRYDASLGLVHPDDEHDRLDRIEEEDWEYSEERPPATGLRRTGIRMTVALVLVVGILASLVAAVYQPDDQSPRWSASAIAELRFAALNAGLSSLQAECFVEAITSRFGPTEPVELAVAQQLVAACR